MGKRGGCIVVAHGDGWALAWPRERWAQLTPAQQQDVIDAQAALMSQNETENRTAARRRSVGAQTAASGGRTNAWNLSD